MWWDTRGSTTPEMQTVARMVLAQPASASICERINSEFAFVKDRRRNRLAHSKASKLVGLFHNLRLLKRMQQVTYAEPAIAWTDDLEQSSVTKFEPAAIGSTSALVPRLWALVPSRLTPRVWSQTAARPFRSSISIPRHFSHAGFRGFIIIHNNFPNNYHIYIW